jgi:acetylornithine deacetylase/succinyl-diaminopimelate desuccinylase-like protein
VTELIIEAQENINEQALIDDTCELIRADSENPGSTEAKTVEVLSAIAERIGATVVAQEVFSRARQSRYLPRPANRAGIPLSRAQ